MACSARAQFVASPHNIVCALARGDLEFWSVVEKLQMTAAWDSQNGFAEKVREPVVIAALTGYQPESERKANKPRYLSAPNDL